MSVRMPHIHYEWYSKSQVTCRRCWVDLFATEKNEPTLSSNFFIPKVTGAALKGLRSPVGLFFFLPKFANPFEARFKVCSFVRLFVSGHA